MKCDFCGNDMMVSGSKPLPFQEGETPYVEMTLVCVNTKCDNFCGFDTNHPKEGTERKIKNPV